MGLQGVWKTWDKVCVRDTAHDKFQKKSFKYIVLKGISSSIPTTDKLPTINKLEMQQSKIFVIGLSTS